ncbi:MAG: DUF4339 domain-containing protein [Saprospiraceae bacterium]
MDKIYFIVENGNVSQAYSLEELVSKNIEEDTMVCKKFEDWKPAKDAPELLKVILGNPSQQPSTGSWTPPAVEPKPNNFNEQIATSNNQNNYQTPLSTQQTIIISGSEKKSLGLAVVLSLIFGPLGLLYSSVTGGVIMFFVSIFIGLITLGFGIVISWLVCVVWSVVAVNNHNEKISSRINSYRS